MLYYTPLLYYTPPCYTIPLAILYTPALYYTPCYTIHTRAVIHTHKLCIQLQVEVQQRVAAALQNFKKMIVELETPEVDATIDEPQSIIQGPPVTCSLRMDIPPGMYLCSLVPCSLLPTNQILTHPLQLNRFKPLVELLLQQFLPLTLLLSLLLRQQPQFRLLLQVLATLTIHSAPYSNTHFATLTTRTHRHAQLAQSSPLCMGLLRKR